MFESRLKSLPLLHRGKVRDLYEIDAHRLLVIQTDRLSAFDVVLPNPIPGKGAVLTHVSIFWFKRLAHIIPNHYLDTPPESIVTKEEREQIVGRAMVVRRFKPLPIEAIVRGYLAGSGWKDYSRSGAVCGVALPEGMLEAQQLPAPIFTPSTKAVRGAHDENISFAHCEELLGAQRAAYVRDIAIALYSEAAHYARSRGILIADTKFEFGTDEKGEVHLIDEVLTPDSSRFWPMETYAPGENPPSFDKQFVRDWLENQRWNKQPPAPELPQDVIYKTAEKYQDAVRRLIP